MVLKLKLIIKNFGPQKKAKYGEKRIEKQMFFLRFIFLYQYRALHLRRVQILYSKKVRSSQFRGSTASNKEYFLKFP